MRKRFHVRISDNVLDEADWPIMAIHIRHNYNLITYVEEVKKGCYAFPNMIGWDLRKLFEWLKYDSTGHHPETYHDIGLYIANEKKFYKCDYTFNIDTVDGRWMACPVCDKTTHHNGDDECIPCINRRDIETAMNSAERLWLEGRTIR